MTKDVSPEEVLENQTLESSGYKIMLYNDDFNTFDWVITCLMKYCNHEFEQAEQCAWIVHTKGKCQVMSGEIAELEAVCQALCDADLSAVIEN
jgi:ATP-dependent Clp protease adaptor protein ClpS